MLTNQILQESCCTSLIDIQTDPKAFKTLAEDVLLIVEVGIGKGLTGG